VNKPDIENQEEKSVPLWTQKLGYKEIMDNDQLLNTIDYIRNNRLKHDLSPNPAIADKGMDEGINEEVYEETGEQNLAQSPQHIINMEKGYNVTLCGKFGA